VAGVHNRRLLGPASLFQWPESTTADSWPGGRVLSAGVHNRSPYEGLRPPTFQKQTTRFGAASFLVDSWAGEELESRGRERVLGRTSRRNFGANRQCRTLVLLVHSSYTCSYDLCTQQVTGCARTRARRSRNFHETTKASRSEKALVKQRVRCLNVNMAEKISSAVKGVTGTTKPAVALRSTNGASRRRTTPGESVQTPGQSGEAGRHPHYSDNVQTTDTLAKVSRHRTILRVRRVSCGLRVHSHQSGTNGGPVLQGASVACRTLTTELVAAKCSHSAFAFWIQSLLFSPC